MLIVFFGVLLLLTLFDYVSKKRNEKSEVFDYDDVEVLDEDAEVDVQVEVLNIRPEDHIPKEHIPEFKKFLEVYVRATLLKKRALESGSMTPEEKAELRKLAAEIIVYRDKFGQYLPMFALTEEERENLIVLTKIGLNGTENPVARCE